LSATPTTLGQVLPLRAGSCESGWTHTVAPRASSRRATRTGGTPAEPDRVECQTA
jgi:hypothetical protein